MTAGLCSSIQMEAQGAVEKKEMEAHEWSCQAMAPRFTMPICRVGPVLAARGMSASGRNQSSAGKKQSRKPPEDWPHGFQVRFHSNNNVHNTLPRRILERLYDPALIVEVGRLKCQSPSRVRAWQLPLDGRRPPEVGTEVRGTLFLPRTWASGAGARLLVFGGKP